MAEIIELPRIAGVKLVRLKVLSDERGRFLETFRKEWFPERTWLLWCKQTGELIGLSGMHHINWTVPAVEIGYWVRTSMAGQGYVTEAVRTITRFAFDVLGAQRVEIRCDERNERSAAVARRAGFTLEGILRNERRHHLSQELRNTMVFAAIRTFS